METPLLIVGWSVRAAAQSARRGGFAPHAIDAFLDVDLQATSAWSRKLTSWEQVAALAHSLPPCEWMYCGGLENHPDVVAAISKRHRLLGVEPAALRPVRDPFTLAEVLIRHGFSMPTMCRHGHTPSGGDERWLVKRFNSAGGIGVRWFRHGETPDDAYYLQERVAGTVWGATYLAANDGCRMLGVCEQIASEGHSKASFQYHGSIGPLRVPTAMTGELQPLGAAVAKEFGLRGLFGIDLIVTADGAMLPLEVNPRYTASVELLERAYGGSMIDLHVRACRNELFSPNIDGDFSTQFGKQIVYYEGRELLTIATSTAQRLAEWSRQTGILGVADVPAAGTEIRPGEPIATVFAAAADAESVKQELTRQSNRLLDLVGATI